MLSVPKYDFHWQLAYELETPLKLPGGQQAGGHGALRQFGRTTNTTLAPEKEVYFRAKESELG